MKIEKKYIPEVEGLRITAAFLVAVYHIWFMRVSGGVDVFFVISGFLITTSLLSKYIRDGYVRFFSFILGLLKRLLPNALTVLIVVTILSYFILPELRHDETIREILASLLYLENWQLALTGTDYLAQNNEKSPVQHFWAMSIQGQFYIIWFCILALVVFLAKRYKINFAYFFIGIISILLIVSLAYSIYLTEANQVWAYFDTRTRVWEFAMGGLLVFYLFKVKVPKFISFIIGWAGFIALLSTGMIFDIENSFPSYIALWPMMSVILILISSQNPSGIGIEKLLGSSIMVKLGAYSYGLYLWHWPLLTFYYVIFETTDVSLSHGLIIILLSYLLSVLSTDLVEKPILKRKASPNSYLKVFRPIITFMGILLFFVLIWYIALETDRTQLITTGDEDYPGAVAFADSNYDWESKEPIPSLANIKTDVPATSKNDCLVRLGDSEVKICEFGELEDYSHTVALVGGSKSNQWLTSLQTFAEVENIRIVTATKSGCRFAIDLASHEDCNEWNENVVDKVVETHPDLVITLADAFSFEEVPDGFITQFERLNEYDIPIMAIRDTPIFEYDIPECLTANNFDVHQCGEDRENLFEDGHKWERVDNPPSNVTYLDYTDYLCDSDYCYPVIGNVVVYRDQSHLSDTFVKSMGPIIEEDVLKLLN